MNATAWLVWGFVFQACFFMRFVVQWIASEREKRSVVPTSFWYFSLAGGMGLFIYAVHLGDPVILVGQTTGVFIYLRNLVLIKRTADQEPIAQDPPEQA